MGWDPHPLQTHIFVCRYLCSKPGSLLGCPPVQRASGCVPCPDKRLYLSIQAHYAVIPRFMPFALVACGRQALSHARTDIPRHAYPGLRPGRRERDGPVHNRHNTANERREYTHKVMKNTYLSDEVTLARSHECHADISVRYLTQDREVKQSAISRGCRYRVRFHTRTEPQVANSTRIRGTPSKAAGACLLMRRL